jgi:phosphoribosylanthranilate isomerase
LSGGLSQANVAAALNLQHPMLFALDLNSGVEVAPGLKNCESISQIIAQRDQLN